MTDLFDGNNEDHVDPDKNYLEDLVGENKKFKSVEDLARGKHESDQFISRLQAELEGLRTELKTRTTVEELINKRPTEPSTPPAANQGQEGEKPASALTADQIEELLSRKLTEHESARTAAQNLQLAKAKLQEAFGAAYVAKLDEASQALGMTRDELNKLAATRPQAFLRLVGADAQRPSEPDLFVPPTSGTQAPTKGASTERNKAFYDRIRQANPSEYWSPKVQNQMHNDALRLGERFFT